MYLQLPFTGETGRVVPWVVWGGDRAVVTQQQLSLVVATLCQCQYKRRYLLKYISEVKGQIQGGASKCVLPAKG
jgi:hypothetical protein